VSASISEDYQKSQRGIGFALNKHSAGSLIIQTYALGVTKQSKANFGDANLKTLEERINRTLSDAKAASNDYLNNVQPKAISLIVNVGSYFTLEDVFAELLNNSNSLDPQKISKLITRLSTDVEMFAKSASVLATDLNRIRGKFSDNSGEFGTYAAELHSKVDGDKGLLKSLEGELKIVENDISGQILGAVGSGLTIASGVALIIIGSCTTIFTGGLSTVAVIGGSALLMGGVAGAVASGTSLAASYDQKRTILEKKVRITNEVKLAELFASGMSSLTEQAEKAAEETQNLANSWNILKSKLDTVKTRLEGGGKNVMDDTRELYLHAVEKERKKVMTQVDIIQGKFSVGANIKTIEDTGKSTGKLIREAVQAA
jgi:Bacillus haemolytic enterotoxin (HBL)